jgi:cytochrome P450
MELNALIGQSVRLLLTRPDLAARLRADPDAVPAAVEEFLRVTTASEPPWPAPRPRSRSPSARHRSAKNALFRWCSNLTPL